MSTEPFDFLYYASDPEIAAFGKHWCGPVTLPRNGEVLVAEYKATPGTDGQDVSVFCYAAPARFYTLKVKPVAGSDGYGVSFGSDQHELAAKLAASISDGTVRW